MKIGLVYYSRTGNTRKVAQLLEEKFKEKKAEVDLIEIEHVKRPGFLKAGKSGMQQEDLPIKNTSFDLKKYDVIVAGTPTWAGKPAPFVKTFMNKAENINGKKAAIFLTSGGNNEEKRKITKEILSNDLGKAGLKIVGSALLLQMKKEKIVDGEENIDNFVKTVLKK